MHPTERSRLLSLSKAPDEVKTEELKDVVKHAEEEARMVLPGIQALFGFQLIAVFNYGFKTLLNSNEQLIHLIALACVALSATLILAPAAYHRQAEPLGVSTDFVRIATRLLVWGLVPLMMGTCLDFYLICRIILGQPALSLALGIMLLLIMSFFWFAFPRWFALPRSKRKI